MTADTNTAAAPAGALKPPIGLREALRLARVLAEETPGSPTAAKLLAALSQEQAPGLREALETFRADCPRCGGSGYLDASKAPCPTCEGDGFIDAVPAALAAPPSGPPVSDTAGLREEWLNKPCPDCKGRGEVDTEHSHSSCAACAGTGEAYGFAPASHKGFKDAFRALDAAQARAEEVSITAQSRDGFVRGAMWARRHLSAPPSGSPVSDTAGEVRLWWMLHIIERAGGGADATDTPHNLLNAFCEDAEPTDTFNLAIERKFISVTHNSDFDTSNAHLTKEGRAYIAATSHTPAPGAGVTGDGSGGLTAALIAAAEDPDGDPKVKAVALAGHAWMRAHQGPLSGLDQRLAEWAVEHGPFLAAQAFTLANNARARSQAGEPTARAEGEA